MKKALAPASKQDTRATLTGSWTLYHGPFSLSIRAAGWGKIAVGSSSGKAPSGCCDPRKPADFKAENSRVRHRFAGVRHGLAEGGEAVFLSCSMMGYRHRERPLPRPHNPAKPRTKKRDSQRNADHKKDSAPGQKKAGFSCGALLVVCLDIAGRSSHARAQTAAKVRTEKRVFGGHKKARKHRRWTPGGALRYHCTRGKCAKLDT